VYGLPLPAPYQARISDRCSRAERFHETERSRGCSELRRLNLPRVARSRVRLEEFSVRARRGPGPRSREALRLPSTVVRMVPRVRRPGNRLHPCKVWRSARAGRESRSSPSLVRRTRGFVLGHSFASRTSSAGDASSFRRGLLLFCPRLAGLRFLQETFTDGETFLAPCALEASRTSFSTTFTGALLGITPATAGRTTRRSGTMYARSLPAQTSFGAGSS